MALKSVLFVALLLIATTSLAHSLILVTYNGVTTSVAKVEISGILTCTGTPCVNVNVYLSLDGSGNSVAQGVTGELGAFTVTYEALTQVNFDAGKAVAFVISPVKDCAVFAQTNVNIYASLTLIKYESGTAQFTAGAFAY